MEQARVEAVDCAEFCFGQSRGFVGGRGNEELWCGCAESEMRGHLEGDRREVCILGV